MAREDRPSHDKLVMKKLKRIPAIALRLVKQQNPACVGQLKSAVELGDWTGALLCVGSRERISLCVYLWPIIPDNDRACVLAEAISCGDAPRYERDNLCAMLSALHEQNKRLFDSKAAKEAFNNLPTQVTIYRGTTESEGENYGVCWTLSRDKAVFFATKHYRFRNTKSLPVILSATIKRDDICGLLVERNEREVVICPSQIGAVGRSLP